MKRDDTVEEDTAVFDSKPPTQEHLGDVSEKGHVELISRVPNSRRTRWRLPRFQGFQV